MIKWAGVGDKISSGNLCNTCSIRCCCEWVRRKKKEGSLMTFLEERFIYVYHSCFLFNDTVNFSPLTNRVAFVLWNDTSLSRFFEHITAVYCKTKCWYQCSSISRKEVIKILAQHFVIWCCSSCCDLRLEWYVNLFWNIRNR